MPMIIINTQDIECTIRQELIQRYIQRYDISHTDIDAIVDRVIECGNQTPAEKPIELVQAILDRWGILRWSPKQRGQLIGELVRACLGIDSPTHDNAPSAGECPDDES